MTLHLVASNPDVAGASPGERVVRKLKFADAELKRFLPDASDDERVRIITDLRRTLGAAVVLLVGRESAS